MSKGWGGLECANVKYKRPQLCVACCLRLLLQAHIERFERFNQLPEDGGAEEREAVSAELGKPTRAGCCCTVGTHAQSFQWCTNNLLIFSWLYLRSTQKRMCPLNCPQCLSSRAAASCAATKRSASRGWPLTDTIASAAPAVPEFQNGRQLRDYQKESLKWMAANCNAQLNCILGDEVGGRGLGYGGGGVALCDGER